MHTDFRFLYNGILFDSLKHEGVVTEHGTVYTLDQGVTVTLAKKEYQKFDAVEWVLIFENTSDKKSGIFSDIYDCYTLLPITFPPAPKQGYRPISTDASVTTMRGSVDGRFYWENDKASAEEFSLTVEYLDKAPEKTKRFENVNGRSSDGTTPFFDVAGSNDGYLFSIGWTGDWKSEFTKTEDGILAKSGLKETRFYLNSGEKIRTSSTLVMRYTQGEEKYNKFRRLIKTHFSHKKDQTQRDGLLAFELWGGLTSEEMKKRISELHSHDIHFEDIWIDAGWYGECTKCDDAFTGDWSQCTGDWNVNLRVHPDALQEVRDCAENAGMHLMLWFEPERALASTRIVREHPEWLLQKNGCNNYIINYGNNEALAYIRDLIAGYVRTLRLSCYRQDFNIDLTEFFRQNDAPDRRGITEIKHITGMYALWDSLLEEFPDLLIDNCSSGGRRIDIETLKRAIPFFRSDYQCNFNENPEVLQTHNANSSLYFPFIGCTSKTKCDTYAIRSAYQSSFGGAFYNAIFQSFDEADFAWAKGVIDEYRSIRRYFHEDFYNHGTSTFDNTSWAIFQYHDALTQSGIVLAFRRECSPFDQVSISLGGTDENKTLIYKNLNNGVEFQGNRTLKITLEEKRSSVIFEYKVI